MIVKRSAKKKNLIAIGVVFIMIALVAVYMFIGADTEQMDDKTAVEQNKTTIHGNDSRGETFRDGKKTTASSDVSSVPARTSADIVEKQITVKPVIEYKELKNQDKSSHLDQLMEKRLQALGITESLDMIVRSDESFIVGNKKVSMTDILEKAFSRNHKIFEARITESEETVPERVEEYGIYVVQPGDNIWNIHFNILKEYYGSQGITVASDADERLHSGDSSGVGKILKFSETMVIIYSLIDEQIVPDINLLEPLSKIVVYNMDEVFSLLKEINYEAVNQIQFDGRTIWIPTQKR